jgi:hypothetical protein
VINPHVPDVTTYTGLCEMMLLGNVCELGVFMQRGFYDGGPNMELDIEECAMARWRYRQFQTWFQSGHVLVVNGRCYEPMAAFRRSLVEFMAALCYHKYKFDGEVPHHKHFTCTHMLHVFGRFLVLEHPGLLETWKAACRRRKIKVFYWDGPKFQVRSRSDDEAEVLEEFENFPLQDVNDDPVKSVVSSGGRKRKQSETTSEQHVVCNREPTNLKENNRRQDFFRQC